MNKTNIVLIIKLVYSACSVQKRQWVTAAGYKNYKSF